jgi:hypothetical protein
LVYKETGKTPECLWFSLEIKSLYYYSTKGSQIFFKECVIELFDDSKQMKPKKIIKKYVKDLKRGYPTEFEDKKQNLIGPLTEAI